MIENMQENKNVRVRDTSRIVVIEQKECERWARNCMKMPFNSLLGKHLNKALNGDKDAINTLLEFSYEAGRKRLAKIDIEYLRKAAAVRVRETSRNVECLRKAAAERAAAC